MAATFYFLRHGETSASQTGGYCGSLDPELTESGHLMADDFAAAYRSKSWAAVFASPMRRTIATAKPLCDAVGISMHLKNGLKELDYGRWEGLTPDIVQEQYHDDYIRWLTDPGWNAPTGGQRGVDVAGLSSLALDEILSGHDQGNILVVSHKATIRIMLCSLLGIDVGRFRERIDMPVASVTIVEMAKSGPMLRALGDRSHLREELRNREGT